MYSVIQPIEVLDDNDEMFSTWMVLATDLYNKVEGDSYIGNNVEEDLQEHSWVIKTSDILKFHPDVLKYLVVAFEDSFEPQPPGEE